MIFFSVRHKAILGLFTLTFSGATTAYGGEYTLKPTVTLVEEYNDNIYETRDDRKTDLITHVRPELLFNYRAPLWLWNIRYAPEYRHYALGSQEDQFVHNFQADGNIRLISNFLYLRVSDIYRQASIDGNRDSPYINQDYQNIFSISPYLQYRLDSRWTAMAGYRYVNRYYSNPGSIDNKEEGVFLNLTREMSSNTSVFMNADFSRVYPDNGMSHERLVHTAGIRHLYASGSSISLQGGYSVLYPKSSKSELSPFWNVGLMHEMDAYIFSLNSGVAYDTEQNLGSAERRHVTGRLSKAYRRGMLGISGSYSEIVDRQTGKTSSQWFTAGADATYEFSRRTLGRALISTDKYLNSSDNQYRNSFTVGIRHELYYDLFAGLDYNRIAYSGSFFTPTGSIEVNRIMAYLTKSF